jgi:hypothetical protein
MAAKPKPKLGATTEMRTAALAAVRADPGATAYRISLHLPMPATPPGELIRQHFPMTLALAILEDLRKDGLVRVVPDPRGQHFYPTERAETDPDDDAIPF